MKMVQKMKEEETTNIHQLTHQVKGNKNNTKDSQHCTVKLAGKRVCTHEI